MFKQKMLWMFIGGSLVLAITIGAVALLALPYTASAQTSTYDRLSTNPMTGIASAGDVDGGFAHPGGDHFPGSRPPGRGVRGEVYLAEVLGITIEELQAAHQAANQKAIDQALAEGLITEAQAEMLKERGQGFAGKGGFLVDKDAIDHQALLAEKLGISVEDLQAAREQAAELAIQAKIDSGIITQEQVDLMRARKALHEYIDRDALFSEVTGLTREEFQTAMRDAFEAAVQASVDDGVLTQEQADQILSGEGGLRGDPGFGRRGGLRLFPGGPQTVEPDSDL